MERGIKSVAGLLVLLVAATALVEKSDAATYVVGDNIGWSIPSGGAATYASWAAKHTFRAGDILGIINKHLGSIVWEIVLVDFSFTTVWDDSSLN